MSGRSPTGTVISLIEQDDAFELVYFLLNYRGFEALFFLSFFFFLRIFFAIWVPLGARSALFVLQKLSKVKVDPREWNNSGWEHLVPQRMRPCFRRSPG